MPHLPLAEYPADLPHGAYHLDIDDATLFRLPRLLDDDYYVILYNFQVGMLMWKLCTTPHGHLIKHTAPLLAKGRKLKLKHKPRNMKHDLDAARAAAAAIPAPAPAPIPIPVAAPRPQNCAHVPSTFSGMLNDKGQMDPAPCNLVRLMTAYMEAQTLHAPMDEQTKIAYVGTYLIGGAAKWIKQQLDELHKHNDAQARFPDSEPHNGPLVSFKSLMDTLLLKFEDIDPEATAQHRLELLQMGKDTVETHIHNFKNLARNSGYNGKALVGYFKRSLADPLHKKVQNMANRPTTLDGWYKQAIAFNRMYHKDQDEHRHAQPVASANKSSGNNTLSRSAAAPAAAPCSSAPAGAWHSYSAPAAQVNVNGPVPVNIDAANAAFACYRCSNKHLA